MYAQNLHTRAPMWPRHMTIKTSIKLIKRRNETRPYKCSHGPGVEQRASTMQMAPARFSLGKSLWMIRRSTLGTQNKRQLGVRVGSLDSLRLRQHMVLPPQTCGAHRMLQPALSFENHPDFKTQGPETQATLSSNIGDFTSSHCPRPRNLGRTTAKAAKGFDVKCPQQCRPAVLFVARKT